LSTEDVCHLTITIWRRQWTTWFQQIREHHKSVCFFRFPGGHFDWLLSLFSLIISDLFYSVSHFSATLTLINMPTLSLNTLLQTIPMQNHSEGLKTHQDGGQRWVRAFHQENP
jgi:hypothetical protein